MWIFCEQKMKNNEKLFFLNFLFKKVLNNIY